MTNKENENRYCSDCLIKVFKVKNSKDYFCKKCGELMLLHITLTSKEVEEMKGGQMKNGRR